MSSGKVTIWIWDGDLHPTFTEEPLPESTALRNISDEHAFTVDRETLERWKAAIAANQAAYDEMSELWAHRKRELLLHELGDHPKPGA